MQTSDLVINQEIITYQAFTNYMSNMKVIYLRVVRHARGLPVSAQ